MNVTYFGIELNKSVEKYHHFLNEARLSALAVCIFLAAHLSIPSGPYKILFLDDIFTGLDTSNRMPLLHILTEKSLQVQIPILLQIIRSSLLLMTDNGMSLQKII